VLVAIGRISRAHGILGEVTVDVRTDSPEDRFARSAQLSTEPATAGPLTVRQTRWHSGRLLVSFTGITDRTAAEGLRGVLLYAEVDESERPQDPEEFFDRQLVGLAIVTTAGDEVGKLAEVVHLPGHDLLSVQTLDGRDVLVPFVTEIVPTVDLDEGRVVIDPPAGLLEPSEAVEDSDDASGAQ
jgi:16S rRNA processing protein RimM